MTSEGVTRLPSALAICALALFGASAGASGSSWTLVELNRRHDVPGTAGFSIVADGVGLDPVILLQNTADQKPKVTDDLSCTPRALSEYSAVTDLGMPATGSNQTSPTSGKAATNARATGAGENALTPDATNCTVSGGWESAYDWSGIGGEASVKPANGTVAEGTPAATVNTSTPEPATLGMFLAGALLLALRRGNKVSRELAVWEIRTPTAPSREMVRTIRFRIRPRLARLTRPV